MDGSIHKPYLLAMLSLLFFLVATTRLGAQEKNSFFQSGKTVYTPAKKFELFGYSGPATQSRTKAVPPVGKQQFLVPQTNAITMDATTLPGAPLDETSLSNEQGSLSTLEPMSELVQRSSPSLSSSPEEVQGAGILPANYSILGARESQSADDRLSGMMLSSRPIRTSLFQGFTLDMAYAANNGESNAGFYQTEVSGTLGLPVPTLHSPLLITPLFSWMQFNMPASAKEYLPAKFDLFSLGIQAEYLLPVNEVLLLDLNARIQVCSDFQKSSQGGIRITGSGTFLWKLDEQTQLVLGGAYTDISRFPVLPIAGVRWRPSENWQVDAIFPNPRLAWRCPSQCLSSSNAPWWLYVAGELTGNHWIVNGLHPTLLNYYNTYKMTYYDYRLLLGLERRSLDEINWALEGGFIIGRSLELEGKDNPLAEKYSPKPTGLVRFKLHY